MNEILLPAVRAYAARRELELAETLGSGKDGIVLVAIRKAQPARVALKALRWPEAYEREKSVYKRLQQAEANNVMGFNVPQLLGFDEEAQVIEMTIVERPFVLDFAGAYLDTRPEFPEDIWREWEAEKREQFEERWPVVERIMEAFEELGIYLLDVSPGNIGFEL
jgi:hypothetical protein